MRLKMRRIVKIIKECKNKYTDNFATNIVDYPDLDSTNLFEKLRKGKYIQDKIETNSLYVEPKQINLENGRFHYVPNLKNLKALFSNEEIREKYF